METSPVGEVLAALVAAAEVVSAALEAEASEAVEPEEVGKN